MQFWTHEWDAPRGWLDALTALKAEKFVRRVFLLAIPTARVDPKKKGYVEVRSSRCSCTLTDCSVANEAPRSCGR